MSLGDDGEGEMGGPGYKGQLSQVFGGFQEDLEEISKFMDPEQGRKLWLRFAALQSNRNYDDIKKGDQGAYLAALIFHVSILKDGARKVYESNSLLKRSQHWTVNYFYQWLIGGRGGFQTSDEIRNEIFELQWLAKRNMEGFQNEDRASLPFMVRLFGIRYLNNVWWVETGAAGGLGLMSVVVSLAMSHHDLWITILTAASTAMFWVLVFVPAHWWHVEWLGEYGLRPGTLQVAGMSALHVVGFAGGAALLHAAAQSPWLGAGGFFALAGFAVLWGGIFLAHRAVSPPLQVSPETEKLAQSAVRIIQVGNKIAREVERQIPAPTPQLNLLDPKFIETWRLEKHSQGLLNRLRALVREAGLEGMTAQEAFRALGLAWLARSQARTNILLAGLDMRVVNGTNLPSVAEDLETLEDRPQVSLYLVATNEEVFENLQQRAAALPSQASARVVVKFHPEAIQAGDLADLNEDFVMDAARIYQVESGLALAGFDYPADVVADTVRLKDEGSPFSNIEIYVSALTRMPLSAFPLQDLLSIARLVAQAA